MQQTLGRISLKRLNLKVPASLTEVEGLFRCPGGQSPGHRDYPRCANAWKGSLFQWRSDAYSLFLWMLGMTPPTKEVSLNEGNQLQLCVSCFDMSECLLCNQSTHHRKNQPNTLHVKWICIEWTGSRSSVPPTSPHSNGRGGTLRIYNETGFIPFFLWRKGWPKTHVL